MMEAMRPIRRNRSALHAVNHKTISTASACCVAHVATIVNTRRGRLTTADGFVTSAVPITARFDKRPADPIDDRDAMTFDY